MATDPAQLADLLDKAGLDTESLTLVVAAGASSTQLATALGVDPSQPPLTEDWEDEHDGTETTAWAIADVPGGALGLELSGYGDPRLAALVDLSTNGRVVGVARSNVQAHVRFGYASDGTLVFDDDEYVFVDSLDEFPSEVRELAALAWTDLDADEDDADGEDDDEVSHLAVALAMLVRVTGVELTLADLRRVHDGDWRSAPSLVYPDEA